MNLQLKKIRTEKGYSQEKMAQLLHIKTSRYGTWERGERAISFSQAIDCADILGCTLDELAGRNAARACFSDKTQESINSNYEAMNNHGRQRLAEEAEMMAKSGMFAKSEDNSVSRTA